MVETISAWLNGTRDYRMGVELFKIFGSDTVLKNAFAKGETHFNSKRLHEEMLKIFNHLNSDNNGKSKHRATTLSGGQGLPCEEKAKPANIDIADAIDNTVKKIKESVEIINPELFQVTRQRAISVYKQAMDKRAVLFNMVPSEQYQDPNTQDAVEARSQLAIEVVNFYNLASQLFDDADYVKIHGRLPDHEPEQQEDPIDKLQPHEIKQALDNARKAFNKLKGKEETPERVALKQKHSRNIEKLEAKWHSLKHTP